MIFQNPPIEIETLPSVTTVTYEPLQPKYLTLTIISTAIFLLVLIGGGLVFLTLNQLGGLFIMGFMALAGILGSTVLALSWFGFYKKGYALRDKDLVYKTGLLWRSVTTLPFNRVQHCEVNQGPLEKALNLAKLKVFTAGGQGSDLVVPGLSPGTAHQLKDFILKKTSDG